MRNAPMSLAAYVYFNGRCSQALEFYKNVFNGSYDIQMKQGDKVAYAKFTAPGIAFEAADGSSTSPVNPDEGNFSLSLNVPDAERAAKLVKSLAEGGTIAHEFGDVEWGGKFAAVHDRFGIEWYVTAP